MLNRTLTLIAAIFAVWISGSAAQATIGSFPYPKWFLDNSTSTHNKLLFRMYGFEGIARNLFVLTCSDKKEIGVEIIPPKSMEELLRSTASSRDRPTDISFSSETSNTYRLKGTYDKISAWAKLPTEKDLFTFLQLFQNEELRVQWEQANIEYLLESNTVHIKQFIEEHRTKLIGNRNEELSYQDVYIRCSQLWERERTNSKNNNAAIWGAIFLRQVEKCWTKPTGDGSFSPEVEINVKLSLDGKFIGPPMFDGSPRNDYEKRYRQSLLDALLKCQPYNLPPEYYEEWKAFIPVFQERPIGKEVAPTVPQQAERPRVKPVEATSALNSEGVIVYKEHCSHDAFIDWNLTCKIDKNTLSNSGLVGAGGDRYQDVQSVTICAPFGNRGGLGPLTIVYNKSDGSQFMPMHIFETVKYRGSLSDNRVSWVGMNSRFGAGFKAQGEVFYNEKTNTFAYTEVILSSGNRLVREMRTANCNRFFAEEMIDGSEIPRRTK